MKTRLLLIVGLILATLCAAPVFSSDRLALVIGSNDYRNAVKLKNAVSDSRLVSKVLKDAGFHVIALKNPGVDDFYRGLEDFKRHSAVAKVGIIYFAGHGIEVRGENYLLPVDAELSSAVQLRSQTVPLKTIMDDLEVTLLPAKVVILDCCRDNPLSRSWMTTRSTSKGLAAIRDTDIPESSVVVYSAAPGEVALDGAGDNSPFSEALATHLKTPGQNLFQSFLKTSDTVVDVTGGQQEPWVKMDGAARAVRDLVLIPEKEATDSIGSKVARKEETKPDETGTAEIGNETMKETAPVAPEETPVTPVGNTETKEEEKVAEETKPLVLPERGYFTDDEVFTGGPYAGYNSYSRKNILRSAQDKLPGAGTPDGKMGGNTQAAIQAYQEENSLPVTGCLDAKTIESLGLAGLPEEEYVAPKKSTPSYTSTSRSSSYTPPPRTYRETAPPPEPTRKKSFYQSGRDRDRSDTRVPSIVEKKRRGH